MTDQQLDKLVDLERDDCARVSVAFVDALPFREALAKALEGRPDISVSTVKADFVHAMAHILRGADMDWCWRAVSDVDKLQQRMEMLTVLKSELRIRRNRGRRMQRKEAADVRRDQD